MNLSEKNSIDGRAVKEASNLTTQQQEQNYAEVNTATTDKRTSKCLFSWITSTSNESEKIICLTEAIRNDYITEHACTQIKVIDDNPLNNTAELIGGHTKNFAAVSITDPTSIVGIVDFEKNIVPKIGEK